MPRREPRRVERLADAYALAEEAFAITMGIDLRRCPAPLRVELKAARQSLDAARLSLVASIQADPPLPRQRGGAR